MTKLICTAENPAPKGKGKRWASFDAWNPDYDHPDAKGKCINEDYDDWRFDCPHCKCSWIYEGPDA